MQAAATEDEAALGPGMEGMPARQPIRCAPVRGRLPAHLPRERVVIPGPTSCPYCQGRLSKLGEDVTETLEVVPRHWKVVQTMRERMACRACETVSQPPAPFHPIARGRRPRVAGHHPEVKFGQHLPLIRQSETFAREGIELDASTMADWVGACTATLAPLVALIRAHVLAAGRIHGDDTTVPVLAKGLHAQALGHVQPVHHRRPHLPDQQRRRTCPARRGARKKGVAVCRLGPRRRAGRGHVLAHRHRQAERHRPARLARDVLRRINDHLASRLHELLPWHWNKPAQDAAAAA